MVVTTCIMLLLLFAGLYFAGNYFYTAALRRGADTSVLPEAAYSLPPVPAEAEAWLAEMAREKRTLQAFDGLELRACIVRNKDSIGRWAILAHGYNGNAQQMALAAKRFYEMGFHILMPDARGCGASGGDYTGMGWHDRLDMLGWIESILEEYAEAEILLYGISMGAATVMMTAGEALPENVKAIVEDSGYTSAWDEFAYQLQAIYHLPAFPLLQAANAVTKQRAGFWISEASAVEQLKKSQTPTLFIHGSEDALVPVDMLRQVYEAAASEKELLLAEGAGHGAAAGVLGEAYWERISVFIGRYFGFDAHR